MVSLESLPVWAEDRLLHVVVETPRGSRAKFAFDPKIGTFTLKKPLLAGLTYPYDWGFIPSTKGEDGDPLDAIVIHDAVTYPGTVIKARIMGILKVSQTEEGQTIRNDRIIATPAEDDRFRNLDQFTLTMRDELQQFFSATHALEAVKLKFLGWKGPRTARRRIEKSFE